MRMVTTDSSEARSAPPVAVPADLPRWHAVTLDWLATRAEAMPRAALYLVPIRIFIGLGWLRSGVEKVPDAGWWTGDTLRAFIDTQLANGLVLRPLAPLLSGPIDTWAPEISAAVAVTQLMIGVCIVLGWRTTVALLAGIVMNLTFLSAGRTDPNVFYLLVAWALLVGGAGTMLGLDGLRSSGGAVVPNWSPMKWALVAGAAVLSAVTLIPFITTTDPSQVNHDPALVLITLALLVAGTATLAALRSWARALRARSDTQG